MNERSRLISKLRSDKKSRFAYIKAKLGVLVPSQIRALRLRSGMARQADLARIISTGQSRVSALETPGAANVTLEVLAKLAAAFKVGLVVKFVPFSEMLEWETSYSQDSFAVLPLDEDAEFLHPTLQPSPAGVFGSVACKHMYLGARSMLVLEGQTVTRALEATKPLRLLQQAAPKEQSLTQLTQ